LNILVIGMTSGSLGGMEFHNLGNFIIVDPLFKLLREHFPDDIIKTSIQLSESFYKKYNLIQLKNKRFWSYGKYTGQESFKDIIRFCIWKIIKNKKILQKSCLLSEILEADLVIDFSGDIYGENAAWTKYLESNLRLYFSIMMKKQVAMIIGSPGPFHKKWKLQIAKYILPKLDLITNREEISTQLLGNYGILNKNMYTTACPSIFFEKTEQKELEKKLDYSDLFNYKGKTLGIILCGWNLPVGPYNKWPREEWEFKSIIELINHLYLKTEYRICLMSHQNLTDQASKIIFGNDHKIISRIIDLIENTKRDRIFTLKDVYTAAESKAIISSFDILVSGRIHGAVQGLSQNIPTAIIDYGHEPKAHKLKGFAKLYDIEQFVCDPIKSENMISIVDNLISSKDIIRQHLEDHNPIVKEKALLTFKLLQELSQN